jgi:hypothetical protein
MWQDVNGGNLVPKPDLARQDKMNTRLFVERDNSLPEAVRADFCANRWNVLLLSAQIGAKWRLP